MEGVELESTIHYIYLLWERKFIRNKEPIYKIRRTTQTHLGRFNQYPVGSKLICQIMCVGFRRKRAAIVENL